MEREPKAVHSLCSEKKAMVAYPNALGTLTIVLLESEDFKEIKTAIAKISDMRVVDITDKTTIDAGVESVFDKYHERGKYADWRQRLTDLGLDPDACFNAARNN